MKIIGSALLGGLCFAPLPGYCASYNTELVVSSGIQFQFGNGQPLQEILDSFIWYIRPELAFVEQTEQTVYNTIEEVVRQEKKDGHIQQLNRESNLISQDIQVDGDSIVFGLIAPVEVNVKELVYRTFFSNREREKKQEKALIHSIGIESFGGTDEWQGTLGVGVLPGDDSGFYTSFGVRNIQNNFALAMGGKLFSLRPFILEYNFYGGYHSGYDPKVVIKTVDNVQVNYITIEVPSTRESQENDIPVTQLPDLDTPGGRPDGTPAVPGPGQNGDATGGTDVPAVPGNNLMP